MCPRTSLANENNGGETYCKGKRNDKNKKEKMLSQRGALYGILKKGMSSNLHLIGFQTLFARLRSSAESRYRAKHGGNG